MITTCATGQARLKPGLLTTNKIGLRNALRRVQETGQRVVGRVYPVNRLTKGTSCESSPSYKFNMHDLVDSHGYCIGQIGMMRGYRITAEASVCDWYDK